MRKGLRVFAAFILLFVTIFSDVRIVKAAPNGEADIYRIWADLIQNAEGELEPDFNSMEISENQPGEKVLVAKFINDGTYAADGEDYGIMLLLNNVSMTAGENNIPGKEQWRMAGNSSISHAGLVASSIDGDINDNNVYPAFTEDITDLGKIIEFYTQYPYEPVEDEHGNVTIWPKHRKYDVIGDHTVDDGNPLFAGTLTVNENVTLEMKDYAADEGGTNGGIIEASWIDLKGKIQMDKPSNDYAPAYIRIYGDGWLHIGENGSLEVADGTELVLDDNASVSENLANLMIMPDGTSYPWSDTHDGIRFKYSSEAGKWIYMVPRFTVDYDERFKWDDNQQRDVQTAFVYANGELINSWHEKTFEPGEEITFNISAPEERAGCSTFVCIETDEYWRATWADNDEEKITVSNNSFSFTPPNSDYFTVRVWWSDYDFFGTENNNEFLIETRGNNGSVIADLPGVTVLREIDEPNQLGGKKQIINKSDLVNSLNNKITFSFIPSDDRMLERADFWLEDGQEEKYSSREDNGDPSRKLINAENGFGETNGSYTYTFDFSKYNPTSYISVDANFEEGWLKANKYFVDFDECNEWDDSQQKDIPKAFVKVGGEDLHNYRYDENQPLYDYTTGTPITFTLQNPEKRNNCTPIVEIETGWGEKYSSRADSGVDANHLITINNNTFSFNPTYSHGFMVRIWWSEYDWFGPGDNEFVVETNSDGGSVTVDLTGVTILDTKTEPNGGSGKKQIISKSDLTDANLLNNKIKFTFTPNTNRRLWNIDLWMDGGEERYCLGLNDPGRQQINEENGFIENNGIYTYTIDVLKYNTNNNRVSVNAWFDDPQNSWIKENKYFVEFEEWQYWDHEQQQDVPHGFVKVGDNNLLRHDDNNDETLYAYTKDTPITFTLIAPEERTGETPIVELETGLGEWYSSKADSGVDANHLINIVNGNTFSFTPKDKYGFRVNVNWSDFDYFWYNDENEFLIRTEYWDKGQGTVTLNKNAKSFIQEGNGRTGVKSIYSNSVLDEDEPLKVVITPAEGNHVSSIDFNFDRPGNGNQHYRYVTGTPNPNEQDERYIFDAGTDFSMEGDIIYYTVPNNAKSANINLNVDFRENHDDININPHGRTVQYRVDNGAYSLLPDGNTIKQSVFENADTIQFKFSDTNGEERGLEIILRDDNDDECWRHPLDSDGTYTLKKDDMGGVWKGVDIELIDWRIPLDGQYMFIWFGPDGELDEKNGLNEEDVYDIPASGPITFSFNNDVYRVEAEPNWSDRTVVTKDSNGVYSYTPDSNKALSFKVYANEEEYIFFEDVNPRGDDQFLIEYEVNVSDYDIPGVGGDASYNVQTVKTGEVSEEITKYDSDFIRNRKRIVLENQVADSINNKLTFTITPNIGCEYDIYEWDQDKTADVKANGNKYELDLSDRGNVPGIMISFYAGNTPLSGTVTIDGTAKYGETLTATVTGEVNEAALQYQWKRGDAVIEGATEATYTLAAGDVGKYVSCEVTSALQTGCLSGSTSGIIAKAEGPAAPTGLAGVPASREGLADGKITGVSVLMEYATKTDFSDRKSCNGTEITNLMSGTYYVRFKEDSTHYEGEYASVTVEDGPADITGTVSISGTAKYGETLTVSVAGSNASEFTYQWYRGDTAISGATASTYTLVAEDINKTVKCEVSDKAGVHQGTINGQSAQILRADGPAAPAGLSVVAPSKSVNADGKITGVSVLMEYASKSDFSDGKSCNGTVITGLKAGTYYVRVKGTNTHLEGNSISVTVPDGPKDLTGTVSISGTTKFGQTLTAKITGSNASNFAYQWKRGNNNISNAVSSTYKLVKEDIGQTITCVVTDKSGNTVGNISGKTSGQIEKADGPAAPANLKAAACTKKGSTDGQITGVNASMEYATKSDFSDRKSCSSTVTGLKAGTYYVRIAETDTTKAGASVTVTVDDGKEEAPQTQDELVRAFVVRFYKEVLGRSQDQIDADAEGINDWTTALLTKEKSGAEVAYGFVNSSEFKNRDLNNDQFVKTMYKSFFNRDPFDPNNYDEGGYNNWYKALQNGSKTRLQVFEGFVNSGEFRNLCAEYGIDPGKYTAPAKQKDPELKPLNVDKSGVNDEQLTAFVERLYIKALHRDEIDSEGANYWKEVIMNGQDAGGREYDIRTVISKGFFLSQEYKNKDTTNQEFVLDCYQAFFNRNPIGTDDEVNYWKWVKELNNGMSRQRMIENGFGNSQEFKNLIEEYGFKIIKQ